MPTANPDPYPPKLEPYLNDPAVTSKIGSQSTWIETNFGVSNQFATTGDWIRSSSSNLELVINAGVRTVIYDGDADYICNYMGVEAMVRASCFVLTPSGPRADPVTACTGCLLENVVFAAVRAAELFDLQRQRQACGSVQERGHALISTSFRGWT